MSQKRSNPKARPKTKAQPKARGGVSAKAHMGDGPAFPGHHHDHSTCRAHALDRARRVCAERGQRLTTLRQRVLELVWRSHKPVGAYDVLDLLARERDGVAPPTVYRALQFLTELGLVHRIERLNAYVGCSSEDAGGACAGGSFLICTGCGAAAELSDPGLDALIAKRAAATGFAVADSTIEIEGLCPDCAHAGRSV